MESEGGNTKKRAASGSRRSCSKTESTKRECERTDTVFITVTIDVESSGRVACAESDWHEGVDNESVLHQCRALQMELDLSALRLELLPLTDSENRRSAETDHIQISNSFTSQRETAQSALDARSIHEC